ncbi:restriction endonuclease subunit S [Marinobacter gelidimuriae]|uniref:restriction endonuclease subunit S n=1 Tax=Marinobacter gelidimuriae TaxID=2739064 RepID=UPI000371C32F|nr:restriction endonuclease subunit S [Marinobacter gelidimuriae]
MNREMLIKKLGELCSFTQGVQIADSDTIKESAPGYVRYIYIRDLFSDKFLVYVKDKYPKKILSESDIVMVNTGNTSGNVYKAKKGVLCNNAFKIAVKESARHLLDHDYLWAYLNSDAREIMLKRLFNPAGQPHVGHKNVARLEISVPPIPEQKKIAKIVSTWDQAITATERLLENSQQRKKGLMQQLLTGKKRLPGFEEEWQKIELVSRLVN